MDEHGASHTARGLHDREDVLMSTKRQERCVTAAIACLVLAATLTVRNVRTYHKTTTALAMVETAHVQRAGDATRITLTESQAHQAITLCAAARSEAAMADAKANWLRAMLDVAFSRHGHGPLPRGLAKWPGPEKHAMEAIR